SPRGGAHRVAADPGAHAELENPREGRGGGRSDDKGLDDADAGIGLSDSGQPQDRLAVHQAVGVERNHEFVRVAPTLAEVADIAGLVAAIVGAATVMEAPRGAPPGPLRAGGV